MLFCITFIAVGCKFNEVSLFKKEILSSFFLSGRCKGDSVFGPPANSHILRLEVSGTILTVSSGTVLLLAAV